MTLLEVCLDDIEGAVVAERCRADRIELCAGLNEGGTTPSIGTVSAVLHRVQRIGVQVLVRQRGGDFVFSAAELDAMCADIEAVRALETPPGVEVGFVLGALTPGRTIDRAVTARLIRACGGAPVTFHKAFDLTPDLGESLDALIDLGVNRVLTSGGQAAALDGADALAGLVRQAGERIRILAAGGIRPHTAAEVLARTAVPEVHLRAAAPLVSASAHGADPLGYDSGIRMATSASMIDDMLRAIEPSAIETSRVAR